MPMTANATCPLGSSNPFLELCQLGENTDETGQVVLAMAAVAATQVLPIAAQQMLIGAAAEKLEQAMYSISDSLVSSLKDLGLGIKEFFSPWFTETEKGCLDRLEAAIPRIVQEKVETDLLLDLHYKRKLFRQTESNLESCKQQVDAANTDPTSIASTMNCRLFNPCDKLLQLTKNNYLDAMDKVDARYSQTVKNKKTLEDQRQKNITEQCSLSSRKSRAFSF